jgi:uncharacterized protein
MFRRMTTIQRSVKMLGLCAMLLCNVGCRADQAQSEEDFRTVEVSTVGMDVLSGSPVVLLRQPDSGEVVPIWVGIAEAQAILRALHGIDVPRPMTHDLMGSLLSHLEVTVVAVVVHDLRDNTYYSRVQIKRADQEKTIDVDSRPSDAIALALRTKSPVRVARKLFIDIPGFEFMPPEGTQQVVRMFGVTVVSPSPELRMRFDLPERPGVVVRDVSVMAEGYGLEAGDLVVEVNDVKVSTPMEFFDAVMESPRGEPVRLRVLRQEQERTVEIPWDASDPHLPPTPTRPGFRV